MKPPGGAWEYRLAIPIRYAPRRAHVPYLWLLATAAAALIAIGPIAAAVFVSLSGGGGHTAFATAPAGTYAVLVRPEADADVVVAVAAGDGGGMAEIARVERLPGYTSYGAVSPDGKRVALVTADAGTQARPTASLLIVELDTGGVERAASDVDYLQTPVWAADGTSVAVTRSTNRDTPSTDVDVLVVPVDGSGERISAEVAGVLGAYAVGFDPQGRLVYVTIGQRGSVLYRDATEVTVLAAAITRDWRLSPDGKDLAFIETSTAEGVHYFGRTVSLGGNGSQAFSLAATGESLGVAWRPGSAAATFGVEPGGSVGENAHALSAAGFDIPLAYSADGGLLAVQRWTGTSFEAPGDASLEIVQPDGSRARLDGFGRFYGWAAK